MPETIVIKNKYQHQRPILQIGISIFEQKSMHLKECIQSCLAQNQVSLEITARIDGNDGISKKDLDWLLEKEKVHNNFKVIKGRKHLGTWGSYKEIFQRSKTPWLCQVDADDILPPKAIYKCINFLIENLNIGMLYTDCLEIDEEGTPLGIGKRQKLKFSHKNLLTQFISYHLRIIRRDIYNKSGGYDATMKYAGDYDLSLRVSEIAEVHYLPLPLYFYRLHTNNTSRLNINDLNIESIEACRRSLKRMGLEKIYKLDQDKNGRIFARELKGKENEDKENSLFYISPEGTL